MPRDVDKSDELGPVLRAIGPLLSFLKKKYILLAITFIGAVVAVLGPLLWGDIGWHGFRIAAGVAAAIAIVADKMADSYDKTLSTLTFRESERSAEKAVDDLNVVLSEAIEVMFLTGAARNEAAKSLRRTIARQASSAIGDGSRATYYTLHRQAGGSRVLNDVVHAVQHGRYDKPERPFVESDDPNHTIWALLDRADEEPEIQIVDDEVYGLDWSKKKYKTFYTVPVKAKAVQLGVLSVNNSAPGAIGGPQRAVILAMARTMALVVASCKGPSFLSTQAAHHRNVSA